MNAPGVPDARARWQLGVDEVKSSRPKSIYRKLSVIANISNVSIWAVIAKWTNSSYDIHPFEQTFDGNGSDTIRAIFTTFDCKPDAVNVLFDYLYLTNSRLSVPFDYLYLTISRPADDSVTDRQWVFSSSFDNLSHILLVE